MPALGDRKLRKNYARYLDQGAVEHVCVTPRPEAGQEFVTEPLDVAAPICGRRIDVVCHVEFELLEHFQQVRLEQTGQSIDLKSLARRIELPYSQDMSFQLPFVVDVKHSDACRSSRGETIKGMEVDLRASMNVLFAMYFTSLYIFIRDLNNFYK